MGEILGRFGSVRSLVHAILPYAIRPVWSLVRVRRWISRSFGILRDVRSVLLICHNPVAAEHLIPVADLLGKLDGFRLYIANDHFPGQEIDKSAILRATSAKYLPVLLALLRDWDLIVYVNHPWGFGAWFWPGTKKIYINHGLYVGKINNEFGEDGVYGPHRTTRPHRGLLYQRMFAASEAERVAAIKADPVLVDRVVVTGSLMADEISELARHKRQRRVELGIPDGHRVVHVTSTWGGASLAATIGDELLDALGKLVVPTTVLFSLHPRFDKFGGVGRTRCEVLNKWEDRDVIVDRDNSKWKLFVAAADIAIADHTSLAFYHAVLGRPVIHVPVPEDAFVAGSPFDRLRRASPRLDDLLALEMVLSSALTGHATSPALVNLLVNHVGSARQRHIEEITRILD